MIYPKKKMLQFSMLGLNENKIKTKTKKKKIQKWRKIEPKIRIENYKKRRKKSVTAVSVRLVHKLFVQLLMNMVAHNSQWRKHTSYSSKHTSYSLLTHFTILCVFRCSFFSLPNFVSLWYLRFFLIYTYNIQLNA